MLHFTCAEENMDPVNSLHAVADGTMKAIDRLFATSICIYGRGSTNMDSQLHLWWN